MRDAQVSPAPLIAGAGTFLPRFLLLNVGLALYGFALALAYRANLGLHAWGIFQTSLTHSIPLTYGQMTIFVGAILIGRLVDRAHPTRHRYRLQHGIHRPLARRLHALAARAAASRRACGVARREFDCARWRVGALSQGRARRGAARFLHARRHALDGLAGADRAERDRDYGLRGWRSAQPIRGGHRHGAADLRHRPRRRLRAPSLSRAPRAARTVVGSCRIVAGAYTMARRSKPTAAIE